MTSEYKLTTTNARPVLSEVREAGSREASKSIQAAKGEAGEATYTGGLGRGGHRSRRVMALPIGGRISSSFIAKID